MNFVKVGKSVNRTSIDRASWTAWMMSWVKGPFSVLCGYWDLTPPHTVATIFHSSAPRKPSWLRAEFFRDCYPESWHQGGELSRQRLDSWNLDPVISLCIGFGDWSHVGTQCRSRRRLSASSSLPLYLIPTWLICAGLYSSSMPFLHTRDL